MDELRAAVADRLARGEAVAAILLHPATTVDVADPALGLPPLAATEIDRVDGLPVVLDELVEQDAVVFRAPARPG